MTATCLAATIEYCINNVDDDVRAGLLSSGLGVRESQCLQRCGHCYAGPFLVVDGELIEGEAYGILLQQVLPAAALEED